MTGESPDINQEVTDVILFINACVRSSSRTRRLADRVFTKWNEPITEIRLHEIEFPVTDEAYLDRRNRLIEAEDYSDPMFALARQFASADRIVIAAPYWDLSFPSALKQYIEHINVSGITFVYTPEGYPKGLCRAGELYYVTTAGGNFLPWEFGFGYIKSLAENFYGISDVKLIQACGLDIIGADVEQILEASIDEK